MEFFFVFIGLILSPLILTGAGFAIHRWWLAHNAARDPGRLLYEKVIELMVERACDWEQLPGRIFSGGYHLPGANIAVFHDGLMFSSTYTLTVEKDGKATPRITPKGLWQARLGKAYDQMQAERAKAHALHAICDALEGLGDNNVIPMRRA